MTLEQKQDYYKKLRKENNFPPGEEITYEKVLADIKKESAEALKKARESGIKILAPDQQFAEGVKAGIVNTDVLVNLGHLFAHPEFEDEYTKKMMYYIAKGLFAPVVVTTIFLEVDKGNLNGEKDTYSFMTKFCYYLDNSSKLEDIAKLTFQQMTK